MSVVARQACQDVLSTPVGTLAVYLERQASAQRMPPLELIRAITARMGEGNQIVRTCLSPGCAAWCPGSWSWRRARAGNQSLSFCGGPLGPLPIAF